MKAAEPIIVLLEKYRQQHGVYPESLSEVGFEETDDVPIYYDKRDNGGAFILWFGKGLGESMAFKSKTGEWVECD